MLRIALGFVVGAIVGVIINLYGNEISVKQITSGIDTVFTILGTLFIGSLRGIAPLLIFFLISTALMRNSHKQGKTIKRQMFMYCGGTFFAALIAVVINCAAQIQITLPADPSVDHTGPSSMSQVLVNIFQSIVSNPIDSLANANFLGVLFWAILFGLAMRAFATKGIRGAFDAITAALTKIVKIIVEFAPFGIAGLVYAAVAQSGAGIFTEYGVLLIVYLTCIFAMTFVFNPILVFAVLKRNPYPLIWRTIKDSAITAFFFRSSAANIPINLSLCKKLGLDEENYSVSIPIGSTINMEGAAITIITLSLVACFSLGVPVDFGPALILSIIATVSAIGASGVSGGSILLVPMACALFGIGGDTANAIVAVGFIIGVIQDSFETALNSSTDVLFTATIQFYEKIKAGKPVHKVIGGTLDDVED